MNAIVECVPNISEGRDTDLIQAVVDAARTEGCSILSVEPDADYNRTVITMAGTPAAVATAATALSVEAIRRIDMRMHSGEHPRLGAVDVCPFIPIQGISMEECASLAAKVGKDVAELTGAPVFLYGASATAPSRAKLSDLRRGEYEGLEARLTKGADSRHEGTRAPDFGPQTWTESAAKSGGCTFGARPVLIAYNVNIPEPDAVVAKHIGTIVRGSGRIIARVGDRKLRTSGMINSVQGMGVVLEQQGISQVSMNLTNASECGVLKAFETVKSLAADHGLLVSGSELVGLIPLECMLEAGRWYAPEAGDHQALVEAAVEGLGLDAFGPFDAASRIIEWAIQEADA